MPKQHDDLFKDIANFQALLAAYRRAVKGKRHAPGAAAFAANLEPNLLRLERQLRDKTWRPGRYTEIQVRDPKPRLVSAAPFRDRVVHHALFAVISPIFERGFIANSYANRIEKGTHRAIDQYERWRDRNAHVLRCDIYRYFPAIDHAILKQALARRIGCAETLWLIDALIDGSNAQETVDIHYAGAHDSPHFQIAPKVLAKTGTSASIAANRSASGSRRFSGMVGMRSYSMQP